MNILPKKSWHVRNYDNIERVRRDEAKAAEEEKERQRRVALAESEARTEALRAKSCKRSYPEETEAVVPSSSTGHINFFEELEDGSKKDKKGNAEYEEEKRQEKEKQEKAIGLLTYLGQSAIEAQNEKPWYLKSSGKDPKEDRNSLESSHASKHREEFNLKGKWSQDPMRDMDKYVTEKERAEQDKKGKDATYEKHRARDERLHRHNKHSRKKDHRSSHSSSHSSSSVTNVPSGSKTMQQLRAERLRREKDERAKAERLLAKLRGEKTEEGRDKIQVDDRERGYNSQFNPDLARKPKRRDEGY